MIDVRRLVVFKAVFDHGSITGAASALGYSPSAISQNISALERESGIELFRKSGRGIRSTEAGDLLATHAEVVLEQVREAEEALEKLRSGRAGRMRVAAFATAGASVVPQALADFTQRHPGVKSELVIAETGDALQRLEMGHIEVAVIAVKTPITVESGSITYHPLLEDPYRIALPETHPHASHRAINLVELREYAWVATASARCNCLPTITESCARAGFTPRFSIEADEFATTLGFVAAGLGVAMVPLLALGSLPPGVSVHRLAASDEPKRYVYAATRSKDSQQLTVASMLSALEQSAGSFLRQAA
ncbi:MAG: LysR family transcriptional regulator [Actinomycetota bacterium]